MLEGLAIRISLFHFIAVKTEAEVENTLLQVKKKKGFKGRAITQTQIYLAPVPFTIPCLLQHHYPWCTRYSANKYFLKDFIYLF